MDFGSISVGIFVYHCHLIGHEDQGMMAKIQVRGLVGGGSSKHTSVVHLGQGLGVRRMLPTQGNSTSTGAANGPGAAEGMPPASCQPRRARTK